MRTLIFLAMATGPFALTGTGFAAEPGDLGREFVEMQASMLEKQRRSVELERLAHEDLDAERYEQAVEKHRESRKLAAEASAIDAELDERLDAAFDDLVDDLDHESFPRRSAASAALTRLGPRALPRLREALIKPGLDAEIQHQLLGVMASIGDIDIDKEGRFRLWAVNAEASTEYTADAWSAKQACGKPDTHANGDIETAWAPSAADGGEQWLELTYSQPVVPSLVRIHETYNPGAVTRVHARGEDGELFLLWEGKDPTAEAPKFFEIEIPDEAAKRKPTKVLRLTLDTSAVSGFNEIDAVELVGMAP